MPQPLRDAEQLSFLAPAQGKQSVTPAQALLVPPPEFFAQNGHSNSGRPLNARLFLGTSSWAFAGWRDLVYRDSYSEAQLSRQGLPAYSQHPLLNSVGIDRGFYAPMTAQQFALYASQVPGGFRFLVKAPELITGALRRDETGASIEFNPNHLDPVLAFDQFIAPCREGLGEKLGVMVFQFSPLPRAWLFDSARWIGRLGEFIAKLPAGLPYAMEFRDSTLLTPRMMRMLAQCGAHFCLSLHDRMPPIERQLRALDEHERGNCGPLFVRWNLRAGQHYAQAKARYAPFNTLMDPDLPTRQALAQRIARVVQRGQTALVIANNKAEGCAPLTLHALAQAVAQNLEPARA